MGVEISPFIIFFSIIWFLFYWILGGVFFAIIALLRLGRVRKVRFSCLFTLLSIACATTASYFGLHSVEQSLRVCVIDPESKAQTILAVIGCGFGGIVGSFLIGMILLILVGFILINLSKSKTKPWFIFQQNDHEETAEEIAQQLIQEQSAPIKKSKFF